MVLIHDHDHPEVSPVVNLDAAGDEDDAAAGGAPDGEGNAEHEEEELLDHSNVMTGDHEVSVVVHDVAGKPEEEEIDKEREGGDDVNLAFDV